MNKRLLLICCIVCTAFLSNAQISLNSFPYIQDFDTYQGTAETIPDGWTTASGKSEHFRGINSGTTNPGGNFAYGAPDESGDYAMGSLVNNGTGDITMCVEFENNTGAPISELYIGYNFEQWRYFGTEGFTVYGTGSLSNVNLSGLEQPASAEGVDGEVTTTEKAIQLNNLHILPGDVFGLCFVHVNTKFNSSGIAIDDFILSDELVVLPVSIAHFQASALSDASVELKWLTESEEGNSHFVVEHSTNGESFKAIGQVQGAGYSNVPRAYLFTHPVATIGTNYYRLQQVDFDGQYTYSPVRTVQLKGIKGIRLYPSIAQDELHILMPQASQRKTIIEVVDLNGRVELQQSVEQLTDNFHLDISGLEKGYYHLRLLTGSTHFVESFMKL